MQEVKKPILKNIVSAFAIMALLISSIPIFFSTTAQAEECNEDFLSQNDILLYNACATGCTDSRAPTIEGNSKGKNEEVVFKWLIGKGFNAAQAAGIMGNIWQESKFNPFSMGYTYRSAGIDAVLPPDQVADSRKAFGLVQWDSGRRQQILTKIIEQFPDSYRDDINRYGKEDTGHLNVDPSAGQDEGNKNGAYLKLELDFLGSEMEGSYYKWIMDDIKKAPNNEEGLFTAADLWNKHFEVSGDDTQTRADQGKIYYNEYKDLADSITPESPDDSGDTNQSTPRCSSNEPAGNVVWYSQCDPKWGKESYAGGNICDLGCGPTSMAMILATLVDKSITPVEVAANAGTQVDYTTWGPLIQGVNAKWGVGISEKNLTMDEAVDFLKSGKGYIWAGGKGAIPYTTGGHMVAFTGVTDDGKITVADPFGDGGDGRQRIANYDRAQLEATTGGMFGVPKK